MILGLSIDATNFFFSVYCQCDFMLASEKRIVSGPKSESVTLQWNIVKENSMDRLATAKLYLLGRTESHLYSIIPMINMTLDTKAKDIFGERISVDIKSDAMYLTLQNLKYNDSGSFRLEAQVRCGDDLSKIKKSVIQLNVVGMKSHLIVLVT